MSDFLYIFRGGRDPQASAQARAEESKRWANWIRDLAAKGHMKGGEPLEVGGKVMRGKAKNVTDGPYAEAKDLVGGYLLITASTLDEATELARGCPIFEKETGSVEIRQLAKLEM